MDGGKDVPRLSSAAKQVTMMNRLGKTTPHEKQARATQREREDRIHEIYTTLPSADSRNARCIKEERYTGNNSVTNRIKTWMNERYYIVKCDKKELFYTVLDIMVILMVMVITIMMYMNNFETKIVPKDSTSYNKRALRDLNFLNGNIMMIVKLVVGGLVCFHKARGLYRRTTLECRDERGYPAYKPPQSLLTSIKQSIYTPKVAISD